MGRILREHIELWSGITVPYNIAPAKAVHFTVPGEPRSKERPRATRNGVIYTPAKTQEAEIIVKNAFLEQVPNGTYFTTPVIVAIVFFNGNKRRRDVDNMAKLVMDALNKVAYEDDYLVWEMTATKLWTTPDKARTEVYIHEIE